MNAAFLCEWPVAHASERMPFDANKLLRLSTLAASPLWG